MKRLILLLLFFVTCSVASYGQITYSSLTDINFSNVDTSAHIVLVNDNSNIPSWKGSVGELLKAISRVGQVITTGSIVDGTITDADISSSANIGIGKLDTTSADGVVSKSRLSNALDDVGSGSGNASGRALQSITADGTDTLDFGGTSYSVDYWQVDLSAVTSTTLNFTNPNTSIVPTYNIHFTNANTDTVTFASTFLDANLDTILSHVFEQGQVVPIYYYNSDYYTNYLTLQSSNSETTTFETEYQNLITYADNNSFATPNTATQSAQNTLVSSLKTIGVWDSIELMYVFTHNSALDSFSLINWKDTANYRGIIRNEVTFSASGATPTTDSSYIDTQWDLVNDPTVLTNSSASWFYMFPNDLTTAGNHFGIVDVSPRDSIWFALYSQNTDSLTLRNSIFSVSASNAADLIGPAVNRGNVVLASAFNGDERRSYYNGSQYNSTESLTGGEIFNTVDDTDIPLLTMKETNGFIYGSSSLGLRLWIVGNIIDPANIESVSNALQTYIDSL
jgi:hypothetical protein